MFYYYNIIRIRAKRYSQFRFAQQTQNIFISHLYNVGPTSKTLGQRCINVIQMFCVCWVVLLYLYCCSEQQVNDAYLTLSAPGPTLDVSILRL